MIAPAPAAVAPYLPHLRYLLLDVNAFPAEQLEGMRNPVACLLWLEGSEAMNTKPIDELDDLLSKPEDAGLRRAFALWVTTTLLPSRLSGVTVPAMEKLEEVSPMITESTIDWTTKWREEGWRKGEAEGRRKGEAELLLRLLTKMYGPMAPAIQDRVHRAQAAQLIEWGERLVTSGSLEEVFGRDRDD